MSLFQCELCGCCEDTALSHNGFFRTQVFDWTGIEDRRGKKLCSACGPMKYVDGYPTEDEGHWHQHFDRVFLPKGMFRTAQNGNLEHIENGDQNFRKYAVPGES